MSEKVVQLENQIAELESDKAGLQNDLKKLESESQKQLEELVHSFFLISDLIKKIVDIRFNNIHNEPKTSTIWHRQVRWQVIRCYIQSKSIIAMFCVSVKNVIRNVENVIRKVQNVITNIKTSVK